MINDQDNSHFRYSLLLKEIDNLASAEGVSAIAMALIQLDGMEEINERFGYLGGDKVLKEFAVRLVAVVGHKGCTFEITGTSFALLIQNPLHEGDAVSGAEKIARVASEAVTIGTGKARLQARMGISLLPVPRRPQKNCLVSASCRWPRRGRMAKHIECSRPALLNRKIPAHIPGLTSMRP